MAMIFQEPMTALNPVMKVGEQIGEVLQIHSGLAPAKRRARSLEAMRDVSLPEPEKLYHAYPHPLSAHQPQRSMSAMALPLDPPLLHAPEPTPARDGAPPAQTPAPSHEYHRPHSRRPPFFPT